MEYIVAPPLGAVGATGVLRHLEPHVKPEGDIEASPPSGER